jgi:hypothetical protein
MTLRIDAAFAAAFAISILCASSVSVKAESIGGEGKQQAGIGSNNHHAYGGHRRHQQAAASRSSFKAQFGEPPPPRYVWGAPPLQDPRDAYHGYFANPIDNPNYHGSADRR